MKAPFPYFGGKSEIADMVWSRLGDTPNFVEPFFGSGAVLLNRPRWRADKSMMETVNDKSGFIANFWRAVRADPEQVAYYADRPVNENDLHAVHGWLVRQADGLPPKLEGDPEYYDAKIAGWWCWGAACWIGSGWCSGNGPWQQVETADGWQLVHLGSAGQGVNRKCVHLGNAGQGVNRKRVHLGDAGREGEGKQGLYAWMRALSERLVRVRVCCGDWSRVCGPTPTFKNGLTAVFFDPPYTAEAGRNADLYEQDSLTVGHEVASWCKVNQGNPLLRIALCGYEGEYDLPGWDCIAWKAHGGYGGQGNGRGKDNAHKERIWFSPHCLQPALTYQTHSLFDMPLFVEAA
jgi:DNA adenine methylase